MTIPPIMIATAILACSPQPDTITCAEGTQHFKIKTSAARAAQAYFPQAEEYCRKRNAQGKWVMEGHYILWGPNGERLEEGEYRDGKRDGPWNFWLPSQLQVRSFVGGRLDTAEVVGAPREFTIDFCACNRQWIGVPWSMGSNYWKVFGPSGSSCIVEVGGEIEMGALPRRFFQVPREVGRLTFRFKGLGLDFSPLAPYSLPDSSETARRARMDTNFR